MSSLTSCLTCLTFAFTQPGQIHSPPLVGCRLHTRVTLMFPFIYSPLLNTRHRNVHNDLPFAMARTGPYVPVQSDYAQL